MELLRRTFVVCFSLLLLSAVAAHAEKTKRVSVVCTCNDATGKAYVEALHDALARSSQYREVSTKQSLEDDVIRISIVSMPLNDSDGRARSALSIVCLHNGAVMHQLVETCNRIPIVDCAASIVHDLAEWES